MLQWFDAGGYMYRDRLNDLVIQTGAVYAFCPTEKIHRFLDWSYEHFTLDKRGCPLWGALTTGYLDPESEEHVATFVQHLRRPIAVCWPLPEYPACMSVESTSKIYRRFIIIYHRPSEYYPSLRQGRKD
jgi:hypothetical protein